MFCKNCGKQVEEQAMFCKNCGTKVGEIEAQKSETLKSKKNKNLIIALGAAAVLIVGIFFLIGNPVESVFSSPEKSVNEFFENLSKGDIRATSEYIYNDGTDKDLNEDIEEELEYIQKLQRKNGSPKFNVNQVNVVSKNNNTCVVYTSVSYDGETKSGKIMLRKQNGIWKIDIKSSNDLN